MSKTAIRVEYRPTDRLPWVAQMYEDNKYVPGTSSLNESKDEAIEGCKRMYESVKARAFEEWLPYDGEDAA